MPYAGIPKKVETNLVLKHLDDSVIHIKWQNCHLSLEFNKGRWELECQDLDEIITWVKSQRSRAKDMETETTLSNNLLSSAILFFNLHFVFYQGSIVGHGRYYLVITVKSRFQYFESGYFAITFDQKVRCLVEIRGILVVDFLVLVHPYSRPVFSQFQLYSIFRLLVRHRRVSRDSATIYRQKIGQRTCIKFCTQTGISKDMKC